MTDHPYAPAAPLPARPISTLSILSLIGAFVMPVAGVILGHVALARIARTGEGGRSLALAGVIVGYVMVVAGIAMLIWIVGLMVPVGQWLFTGMTGGYS